MRVLLDESVSIRLAGNLPDHECSAVHECGWSGLSDIDLAGRAREQFDAVITHCERLAQACGLLAILLRPIVPGLTETDVQRIRDALAQSDPGQLVVLDREA